MGYSNYKKIEQVTKKFGLSAQFRGLFKNISLIEPSQWLLETLEKAKLVPLRNEKVKSERIVSPLLVEIAQSYQDNITLFSGEDLPVDSDKDLSGECDFFFVLAPYKPYLESPIISLVEAKDEDMDYGIAQCAAQLYGAKLFNEMERQELSCSLWLRHRWRRMEIFTFRKQCFLYRQSSLYQFTRNFGRLASYHSDLFVILLLSDRSV